MRKPVAIALIVTVGCFVSVRCIAAPVPGSDARMESAAGSTNELPDAPAVTKSAVEKVALDSDKPVEFGFAANEGVGADGFGQASPAPAPRKHHRHVVRTVNFVVAVGVVLPVTLVVLLDK